MSKIYNKNFTKDLKNPRKMYIQLTSDELVEFFSKGLTRIAKEKCKNLYSTSDLMRCILPANNFVKTDDHRYIVDLMMYALEQMEDLKQIVNDLQDIIAEYEKNTLNEEVKEKQNDDNSRIKE